MSICSCFLSNPSYRYVFITSTPKWVTSASSESMKKNWQPLNGILQYFIRKYIGKVLKICFVCFCFSDMFECSRGVLVQRLESSAAVAVSPCWRHALVLQHGLAPLEGHQTGEEAGRCLVCVPALCLLPAHRIGLPASGDRTDTHDRWLFI